MEPAAQQILLFTELAALCVCVLLRTVATTLQYRRNTKRYVLSLGILSAYIIA